MRKRTCMKFGLLFLVCGLSGCGNDVERAVDTIAGIDPDHFSRKYTFLNDASRPVTVIPRNTDGVLSVETNASGDHVFTPRTLENRGDETTYEYFANPNTPLPFTYRPKDRVDVLVYNREAIFRDR